MLFEAPKCRVINHIRGIMVFKLLAREAGTTSVVQLLAVPPGPLPRAKTKSMLSKKFPRCVHRSREGERGGVD